MRSLASFIMRGPLQAGLAAAALAVLAFLLPPISYLSAAGVGLVTLRRGAQQGLMVLGIATAALGVGTYIFTGNSVLALAFTLTVWLPLWVLAGVLRATQSLEWTLILAALMGVLLIVVMHLSIADTETWWRELLERVRPLLEQSGMIGSPQDLNRLLGDAARIMTGLLAAALVLSLSVSLFIARWWQALLYNAGGFRREFHELYLSRGLAIPVLAALALAVASTGEPGLIGQEILTVALVLYLIQGLALAHRIAAKRGAHSAWLVALYGMLAVLPQISLLLAAVGFASTWMRFRPDAA